MNAPISELDGHSRAAAFLMKLDDTVTDGVTIHEALICALVEAARSHDDPEYHAGLHDMCEQMAKHYHRERLEQALRTGQETGRTYRAQWDRPDSA